jgi:hypothetical protein
MKKSLIPSLIVYILYTLFGGGMVVYNYIAIGKHNAEGGGLEGLGLALLMIVGIVIGGVGLIGLIFKLIHIKSGWGFFGFLCLLLDILCVGAVFYYFALEIQNIGEALLLLAVLIPSNISLISNLISLKN